MSHASVEHEQPLSRVASSRLSDDVGPDFMLCLVNSKQINGLGSFCIIDPASILCLHDVAVPDRWVQHP